MNRKERKAKRKEAVKMFKENDYLSDKLMRALAGGLIGALYGGLVAMVILHTDVKSTRIGSISISLPHLKV